MKKAEAISILATSVRPREAKDRARYDKAVKMAIEALNCSEFPNNSDTISRQAAITAIKMYLHHIMTALQFYDRMADMPNCNNCGAPKGCQYRPAWGQPVRWNCPHWTEVTKK